MLRKRRTDSKTTAAQTAQSPEAIDRHRDAKLKRHKTKKNLLKTAKSKRTLHTAVYSDTAGNESDEELSPSPKSTEEAGNNGVSPTASKVQELRLVANSFKKLTGLNDDANDDVGYVYVQEEGDWGDFEFTEDEAGSFFAFVTICYIIIATL